MNYADGMMEKTRMYIFRGTDPEEPIISSGQICTFEALQVRSVLPDTVLSDPENPMDDLIVDLDIKVSDMEQCASFPDPILNIFKHETYGMGIWNETVER